VTSLNLSLFDTPADPSRPAPEPPTAPAEAFKITKTRFGRDIIVTPADPAPESLRDLAAAQGLPLFTGPEVMRLAGCPDELIEKIILAKITFPGSHVSQFIQGDA
jgi:hypothetical protein